MYGGWVKTSARKCCTTSDVLLEAKTTVPATCYATCSKLHHATSAKFARRKDQYHSVQVVQLTVHQTVNVKELRELFDCSSYILIIT
jgi:hypothetical protein